jgi:phosphohistidine phosphatase
MSTSKKAKPEKQAPPAVERFIVFLRHGIAEDPSPGRKDEDRGLTGEGHARMKEVARGLAAVLPKAEVIYSSPLLRAVQTSLWVSKAYKSRVNISTSDALAPGTSPKQFLALLASIEAKRVIFVGHEPTLTTHMAALIGMEPDVLELKKGGCYGVRLEPEQPARLEWLLTPRLLRNLS